MYVTVSYINGRHECVFARHFTRRPYMGILCTLSKTALVPCALFYADCKKCSKVELSYTHVSHILTHLSKPEVGYFLQVLNM